jgi:hypothetical protein
VPLPKWLRVIEFATMKAGTEWIVTSEGFLAKRETPGSKTPAPIPAGARVIVLKAENSDHVRFSHGGKNYWTLRAHFEASCKMEAG